MKIRYAGGMRFIGETPSGHEVPMDAGRESGGENSGPRPMEMVLVGLGGCTGMDVISILEKKKQEVTGFEINISARKAPDHPKKYTDIEMEYVIKGKGISEEAVKRAIALSMDKYCSVKATIEGVARITFSYKILAPGE